MCCVWQSRLDAFVTGELGTESHAEYPDTKLKPNTDVPSLYPVQFPFRVQYSILARSQKLLEECCYDFTQKYTTNLLNDKKWDCAEAIELNRWSFTMIKRYGKRPAGPFKKSDSNIDDVLLAVNKIRHSAVHRLRISAKGILQMVGAGVKFAETLSDSVRASQLEELYKELQSKIKSQELSKNYLETKLKAELDEIERQREELAKREREAISTIVIEDKDNMHFIGSLIEGKLRIILGGDNTDDEVHDSDPNNPLDDAKAEATDGDTYKEDPQQDPEPPKLLSNGIKPSDKIEDEEIPMDTATGGSTEKGCSTTFQSIPFDDRSFQFTNSSLAFGEFRKHEDDSVEKSRSEQARFIESTAAELQPEAALDDFKVSLALVNDQSAEESRYRESDAETRTETESQAVEPLKLAGQDAFITNVIQSILKNQEIDTSYFNRKRVKSKKKLHRKAYDIEITKIKGVVLENLRHEFENVRDFYIFFLDTK